MDKRTLFYGGRLFSEVIAKGEDYTKLSKVITINILDFNYLYIDKFHSKFHLWEDDVKDFMLTDLVEIHFIEVSKFRDLKEKDLKKDKLQRWLTFFNKDISDETLKELMEMDEDIKKVEDRLEYLSQDPKVRELYEAREKSLHERANMINGAKEEGRKEGIQQGMQQAKKELVKNLLLVGVDTEKIIKASGLTKEDIESIKRESQH